jgi:hypothetical protein
VLSVIVHVYVAGLLSTGVGPDAAGHETGLPASVIDHVSGLLGGGYPKGAVTTALKTSFEVADEGNAEKTGVAVTATDGAATGMCTLEGLRRSKVSVSPTPLFARACNVRSCTPPSSAQAVRAVVSVVFPGFQYRIFRTPIVYRASVVTVEVVAEGVTVRSGSGEVGSLNVWPLRMPVTVITWGPAVTELGTKNVSCMLPISLPLAACDRFAVIVAGTPPTVTVNVARGTPLSKPVLKMVTAAPGAATRGVGRLSNG